MAHDSDERAPFTPAELERVAAEQHVRKLLPKRR